MLKNLEGICDCGDVNSWKSGVYCKTHEPSNMSNNEQSSKLEKSAMNQNSGDSVSNRLKKLMRPVLNFIFNIIIYEKNLEQDEYLKKLR